MEDEIIITDELENGYNDDEDTIECVPRKDIKHCELCGRETKLSFHHLIPCAVHKRNKFLKTFGRDEMKSRGLMLCKLCHDGIHDIIPSEKTLAESYNTKELLMAHEGIIKHVAWATKQKV